MSQIHQEQIYLDLYGEAIPHYEYEEYGIQGVGKDRIPIVSMDSYRDQSMDTELHGECLKGLALCEKYAKTGMSYGTPPPETGAVSWSTLIKNIEEHDPTGFHRKNLFDLVKAEGMKAVYRYCFYAMGATIPWYFGLYLKENKFFTKTEGGKYTEAVEHFPLLMDYIESLPFKSVGRVLFFCTYPGAGVPLHRDGVMVDHKDHNMCLFFAEGSRPSHIWDEVKKEKVYLEKGAKSYFFNNRDYHGVDPEPQFKYTLRVDGVFNDDVCHDLGLVDGYTWCNDYRS